MNDSSVSSANMSTTVSPGWHYFSGTFSLLCLLCGSLTNGSVIFVFIRNPGLRQAKNLLLINLTVADLGLLLLNTTMHAAAAFNKQWPFGQIGCNVYAFGGGLCGLTSIATMAAIALTRLAAVINPLSSLKLTAYFTLKCVVCSWLYGLLWIVPPLFGLNRFVLEGFGTSCTFDYVSTDLRSRLYMVVLMVGGFVVPLAIIVTSYVFILAKLSNRGKHVRQRGEASNASAFLMVTLSNERAPREDMTKLVRLNTCRQSAKLIRQTEIRVTRTALLVCGIFCLAWTPYAFMALLAQLGYKSWLNVYTISIAGLMTKMSACVNPFIYAFSSSIFRQRVYFCLTHYCCRDQRKNSSPFASSNNKSSRKYLNSPVIARITRV